MTEVTHLTADAQEWDPELDELERRRAWAKEHGGAGAVARQRAAGRGLARERIDQLADAGSFREIGTLTGAAEYDGAQRVLGLVPANPVIGRARVGGRPVSLLADDFTLRGGSADGTILEKWAFIERHALEHRTPLVRLVDGAGGSVKTVERHGATVIPGYEWPVDEQMATIPVVGVALGPCAGFAAVKLAMSHFSVMVSGTSQVFAAGPAVVAAGLGETLTKDQLGGSAIHTRGSGVVDNEAATERDALEQARRFLSYLPSNVFELPPVAVNDDDPRRADETLASVVPRNSRRPYPMRSIIASVVDAGSQLELGRWHGRSQITMLARVDGRTVGVTASDPMHYAGALTASSAEKLTRFVDLCDTFHVPVVTFQDCPGMMIGQAAEQQGTIRKVLRARMAIAQSTVPWCTFFVRRAFGVGGALYGPLGRASVRYAWPSARWGSLPLEGGVEAAYRREIAQAEDPEALRRSLTQRYAEMASPFRTAERFGIEEIVDPRQTRTVVCEWVADAYRLLPETLGRKGKSYRP
jgi:acetyl-CoA carboxylase carboxyltransferase component